MKRINLFFLSLLACLLVGTNAWGDEPVVGKLYSIQCYDKDGGNVKNIYVDGTHFKGAASDRKDYFIVEEDGGNKYLKHVASGQYLTNGKGDGSFGAATSKAKVIFENGASDGYIILCTDDNSKRYLHVMKSGGTTNDYYSGNNTAAELYNNKKSETDYYCRFKFVEAVTPAMDCSLTYQIRMKNTQNYFVSATDDATYVQWQTSPDPQKTAFTIEAVGVDEYLIYNVSKGKYLKYTNTDAGQNKVVYANSRADANAKWYIIDYKTKPYKSIVPAALGTGSGVNGWNFYGGTGATKNVGLYSRSDDNGGWYFTSLPISGRLYTIKSAVKKNGSTNDRYAYDKNNEVYLKESIDRTSYWYVGCSNLLSTYTLQNANSFKYMNSAGESKTFPLTDNAQGLYFATPTSENNTTWCAFGEDQTAGNKNKANTNYQIERIVGWSYTLSDASSGSFWKFEEVSDKDVYTLAFVDKPSGANPKVRYQTDYEIPSNGFFVIDKTATPVVGDFECDDYEGYTITPSLNTTTHVVTFTYVPKSPADRLRGILNNEATTLYNNLNGKAGNPGFVKTTVWTEFTNLKSSLTTKLENTPDDVTEEDITDLQTKLAACTNADNMQGIESGHYYYLRSFYNNEANFYVYDDEAEAKGVARAKSMTKTDMVKNIWYVVKNDNDNNYKIIGSTGRQIGRGPGATGYSKYEAKDVLRSDINIEATTEVNKGDFLFRRYHLSTSTDYWIENNTINTITDWGAEKTNNRYAFEEADMDYYTFAVEGKPENVGYPDVTCNVTGYTGNATVSSNGGFYIFAKGTSITEGNFTTTAAGFSISLNDKVITLTYTAPKYTTTVQYVYQQEENSKFPKLKENDGLFWSKVEHLSQFDDTPQDTYFGLTYSKRQYKASEGEWTDEIPSAPTEGCSIRYIFGDDSAYPVSMGTTYNNTPWYRMIIKRENNKVITSKYCRYLHSNPTKMENKSDYDTRQANDLFGFIGDPVNGFKIVSLAAGSKKALWRTGVTTNQDKTNFEVNFDENNASLWSIKKNTDADYYWFRCEGVNSEYAYMNDISNVIGIWNASGSSTDTGGRFTIELAEPEDVQELMKNYINNNLSNNGIKATVENAAGGGKVGYPQIPADKVETMNTAYNNLIAKTGSVSDYDALQEICYANNPIKMPEAGKLYIIRTASTGDNYVAGGKQTVFCVRSRVSGYDNQIFWDGNWDGTDNTGEPHAAMLWSFEQVDSKFKIRWQGSGDALYIPAGIKQSANATINETAGEYELMSMGNGEFAFTAESGKYLFAGYAGKAGEEGHRIETWTAQPSANAGERWTIEEVPSQKVTITAAGWATACFGFDAAKKTTHSAKLANAVMSDADATYLVETYYLTHADQAERLTKVAVDNIEYNTSGRIQGVVMKGSKENQVTATYFLDPVAPQTIGVDNKLIGTLKDGGDYFKTTGATYYILSNGENGIGFYLKSDSEGTHCDQYKAVMFLNDSEKPVTGIKGFSLDDDEPTAISDVDANIDATEIYNLAGQTLYKFQKGVNIVNGKKVLF